MFRSSFTVPGLPCAKPRMTRADKWQKRDCTEKFWAFADEVRTACTGNPQTYLTQPIFGIVAFFHFPIPASYLEKKRSALHGTLHLQKPDTDNLLKGIADALTQQDKGICLMQGYKFWVEEGEEPHTDIFLLSFAAEYVSESRKDR